MDLGRNSYVDGTSILNDYAVNEIIFAFRWFLRLNLGCALLFWVFWVLRVQLIVEI